MVNIVLHVSGHSSHEWTSFSAMEDIFKFIQEKFDTVTAKELSKPMEPKPRELPAGQAKDECPEPVRPHGESSSSLSSAADDRGGAAEGVGVPIDERPLVLPEGSDAHGAGLRSRLVRMRTAMLAPIQWFSGVAASIYNRCRLICRFVCTVRVPGSAALPHWRHPVSIALVAIVQIGLALHSSSALMCASKEQGVDAPDAADVQTTAPAATGAVANATLSSAAVTIPGTENEAHSDVEGATRSHTTLNMPKVENETPSNFTAAGHGTPSHTVVTLENNQ